MRDPAAPRDPPQKRRTDVPRRAVTLLAYPELCAQWHPTKNGQVSPHDVAHGSNRRVWWRCPHGPDHVWQATVNHRALNGQGCPFCAGKRASVTNSLAALAPHVARQWHPTKNGALGARDVVAGSERRAWWACPRGPDHTWQAVISSRAVAGAGCPFCAGKCVSVTNALAFSDPALARQWHSTKNGALTPKEITLGSDRKVWWRCSVRARHAWASTIANRRAGNGCPFCSHHRVSHETSLAVRRPDVAAQWHPTKNGLLTPRDVLPGSGKRVWWTCPAGPDHEWEGSVSNRTKAIVSCPFCAGDRVSVTNCLATCFPALAAKWHPTKNGALTPRDVLPGTAKKAWWVCVAGHEWPTVTNNRTRLGSGCPDCHARRRKVAVTRRTRRYVHLPEG